MNIPLSKQTFVFVAILLPVVGISACAHGLEAESSGEPVSRSAPPDCVKRAPHAFRPAVRNVIGRDCRRQWRDWRERVHASE